jgi:hypothetical protein
MARLLRQQEDFLNQPSLLEEVITQAGECIFLPKFHSELNPIEMASDFLHVHTLLELK